MDQDQVKGKLKDIAGAAERKAGEWTGSKETKAKGAAKQAEGKLQNAWGTAKDAVKHPPKNEDTDDDIERRDRAVNE